MQTRLAPVALSLSLTLALSACAHGRDPRSYLPVGAPAQYGDRTEDGVVLMLAGSTTSVVNAVERGLAANGYQLRAPAAGSSRAGARALGGDTTLTVRADVTPEDPSGGGVVVVLSGSYSVPSARIRDARVIQRPGESSALYARLRAVADSTRRFASSTP